MSTSPYWQHQSPLSCPKGHEMIWLGSRYWICPKGKCNRIYAELDEPECPDCEGRGCVECGGNPSQE